MKMNFWQWLGVALLVIGLVLYVVKKTRNPAPAAPGNSGTTAPR